MKIDAGVAAIARLPTITAIFLLETLLTRPSLDQCPIDGKVFI
jgi:hypothetical protein